MKLTPLIGTAPLSEKVDSAATQTKLLGVKNSTKWPWRPLHGQPGKGWHWLTLGGWVTIKEWHFGWHWVRLSVWQVECCQGMRTSSSKRTIHNAPHGERAVNAETNIELSPFPMWIQESEYPINQLKVKQATNIFLLLLNPTPRIPQSFSSSTLLVCHKKSGWLKLGNEKNYRTSIL